MRLDHNMPAIRKGHRNMPQMPLWGILLISLAMGCQSENHESVTGIVAGEREPLSASNVPLTPASFTDTQTDWPGFRGPGGMGVGSSPNPPLTWSHDENLAWKIELPGPGASSPIIWGDRIYLTCYSGYFVPGEPEGSLEQLKRHLLAINLSDGEVIWSREIAAKLPEESQIRDHGYAANTPAADEDHVYVFFGKTGLFAFDHDGRQRWQASVGEGTSGWGTSASPLLHDDLVIVNASVESESLIALDRQTGEERWRVGEVRESWNTPVITESDSGRTELLIAMLGRILAVNPATGEAYWSCQTDIGWYMVPSIVSADGVNYCLGGRSGIAALAVRGGGTGDVTTTHRIWTSTRGSNVSSPVVHDGRVYWVNDSSGVAGCADGATGELLYEQRLDRAGQVYASALLVGDRLYYLTRDGKTFVLEAKPEFQQLAVNDLRDGSIFDGSPAVAGDRLVIRSNKFLYCIGP
jgi:outer membrane protein assembly factor BamB